MDERGPIYHRGIGCGGISKDITKLPQRECRQRRLQRGQRQATRADDRLPEVTHQLIEQLTRLAKLRKVDRPDQLARPLRRLSALDHVARAVTFPDVAQHTTYY